MSASSESNRNSASALDSSVLPTPDGPRKMKRAGGALGVLQAGAAAADGLRQRGDGLVLADDALVQHALHAQQLLGLGLGEVGHGHAGGHGDDVGDVLAPSPDRTDFWRVLSAHFFSAAARSSFRARLLVAQLGGALEVLLGDGLVLLGADLAQLVVHLAQLRRASVMLRMRMRAPASSMHVDGLVGQEAVLDIAVGQRDGGLKRLVGEVHAGGAPRSGRAGPP